MDSPIESILCFALVHPISHVCVYRPLRVYSRRRFISMHTDTYSCRRFISMHTDTSRFMSMHTDTSFISMHTDTSPRVAQSNLGEHSHHASHHTSFGVCACTHPPAHVRTHMHTRTRTRALEEISQSVRNPKDEPESRTPKTKHAILLRGLADKRFLRTTSSFRCWGLLSYGSDGLVSMEGPRGAPTARPLWPASTPRFLVPCPTGPKPQSHSPLNPEP